MNQRLALLQPYPFEKLALLKKDQSPPSELSHIPLSIGEPQHETPAFIIEALMNNMSGIRKYPATKGTAELRQSISDWLTKRFNLKSDQLDFETHILPVNGTREALFAFAQATIDTSKSNPIVICPNPFYQIYEGAALLSGAQPYFVNATKETGYLPNFSTVPETVWENTQLLYLCSPSNPTGAVASIDYLKSLLTLADKYDFIIAQDECYSELYLDETAPPLGLLDACSQLGRDDFKRCVVFHSLSKRSNAPGLRSGFVAGDASIIDQFLKYRTYHGSAMGLTQQAASTVAWQDETHVQENRTLYRAKFSAAKQILSDVTDIEIPPASFYIWLHTPVCDELFAQQLFAKQNVTVLPGSYLSRESNGINPGENHVRLALVAEPSLCEDALHRIKQFYSQL